MFDSTKSLAVVTNLAGKPIERYEASPFGERRILVDSIPPAIEQVRVVDGAVWVEVSEAVLGEALLAAVNDGTLRLRDVAAGADLTIAVDQPVREGGQALRRIVLVPDTEPAASTSLELIVEAGVLVDSFANTPSADYVLPFGWPATDAVITDTAAPEVAAVVVRDGVVEVEWTEEVDPTSSAITVDGGTVAWIVSDDRYTLTSGSALATGSHTLDVTTSALDLGGTGLAETFQTTFTVEPQGAKSAFVAPDEREVAASTIGNHVGFHGRPVNPATGLVYFRNRWFDPDLGRFISPDPLGFVDGPSMYQFAGYSPANYSDPLGLCVGGLRDSALCKGVNRLMAPGEHLWARDLRLERRLTEAKKNAIRIEDGSAVSPRIQQEHFSLLAHGRLTQVNGIVVHQTGGPTASSTFNTYRTSKIGAQFLLDLDGTIYETSPVGQVTWHVGKLKSRCLDDPAYCVDLPLSATFGERLELLRDEYGRSFAAKAQGPLSAHRHEMKKRYPFRYPSNTDSIGIEMVGLARNPATGTGPFWNDAAVYDDVTEEQNRSLAWLIRQLSRVYGLQQGDIYLHPTVSIKNKTEGQSARWR